MEKYTKEKIEQTRRAIIENGGRKVETDVAMRRFTYYQIPADLNPQLPDFVCRATGDPRDGYVLGISDEFPEDMQRYAVFHEYMEFIEIGIDTQGRCLRALEAELAEVPREILHEYIARRAKFFRNLIPYIRENTESYTQEDIKEMEASRDRLNQLEKELKGGEENNNDI